MLIFADRTAKLADLGLSRPFRPAPPGAPPAAWGGDMRVDRELVTLWSRAPELLLGAPTHTAAVDAWGAGYNMDMGGSIRRVCCGLLV